MSELTCDELIEIFKKTGGTLICGYDSKTCFIDRSNMASIIKNIEVLNCKIKGTDLLHINNLYKNYDKYMSNIPETDKGNPLYYSFKYKNSGGLIIHDVYHNYLQSENKNI